MIPERGDYVAVETVNGSGPVLGLCWEIRQEMGGGFRTSCTVVVGYVGSKRSTGIYSPVFIECGPERLRRVEPYVVREAQSNGIWTP